MKQQTRKPLNGTKTHPLTAHALAELRDLANKPPTVASKLGNDVELPEELK